MKDIVVDYETYYSKREGVSAATQGLKNYVDSSYAYMLALKSDDLEWVGTIEEARKKFGPDFWGSPGHQFWAANANFDETWTRKCFDVGPMKPWNCVLDRAAWSQLPRHVAGVARVVLGVQVDKSTRDYMDDKHYDDLPDDEKRMVLDYCKNDAIEEFELLRTLPQPTAIEEKIAAHTRMMNLRGVRIDAELLERDRIAAEEYRHACMMKIPWAATTGTPLSIPQLSKWAASRGLEMPMSLDKRDLDSADTITAQPDLRDVVDLMRGYRKANTVLKKIMSIRGRLTEGDILPMDFIYCGARHTRRWSSQGANLQNLESTPFDLGGHFVAPRHWLVPRPGKDFLVLDYAQIEPRCLAWLTNNEDLLDMIRRGFGVYEAAARASRVWTSEEPLKTADPTLYKLVKAQELGLGYGMGAVKFNATLPPDLRHENPDEVKEQIYDWRRRNFRIVGLWREMDRLIIETCRDPKNRTIELEMPTGDYLRHFSVMQQPGKYGMGFCSLTIKGDRSIHSKQDNLWGGVLVENVTQRMARDVIAEAVVRLEAAGLPVILHAHDEVVLEVDTDSRDEARAEAERIMKQAPEWAPDLPLEVEGEFHRHYTK